MWAMFMDWIPLFRSGKSRIPREWAEVSVTVRIRESGGGSQQDFLER